MLAAMLKPPVSDPTPAGSELSFADAEAEFACLLPRLPKHVRRRFIREFALEVVIGAYADSGVAPPRWVREAVSRGAASLSPAELRTLRSALRRRIMVTSREAVAEETGVTPGTLHHVLLGRKPQKRNLIRLERWYRDAVLAGAIEVKDGGAGLVLKPFLRLIPPAEHDRAASELITILRELYARHGWEIPAWVNAATAS
ncbi:MAG TPA: hypothetical protein VFJ16_20695 [Longimicrobium sp.]|nr:hypothetical protein [Longimicrobium sp.]